mgnify:CR=1 FL=1
MENKTNFTKSVTGVVIHEGKVLLARHTYGAGKDMLIIPGGYVDYGESPEDALRREYMEETGTVVEPKNIIGIRFNMHDWYIAFTAEYISGNASSDKDENSEVVWMDVQEALSRQDVPELTKRLINAAVSSENAFKKCDDYKERDKYAPYSFYC